MQAMAGQHPQLQGNETAFFDEGSREMMPSLSRRLSRGSSSHRAGNSMRVVKPSSANNSPQALWASNRRRTMMHDTASSRRTQQVLEQLLSPEGLAQSHQTGRSSRPVSWHPGSYLQQQALQANFVSQQSQQPHLQGHAYFTERQQVSPQYPNMSPGMVACSASTSPASTFSPLPMQYPGLSGHQSQYLSPEAWQAVQKSTPFYPTPNESRDYTEPFPAFGPDVRHGAATSEGHDWQSYMMHGMHSTTPPTPDSFMPEPAMPQDSPSFQTLDEPEEEGEVLVGMGLYDGPEKMNEDPQLDNYRSTVSSLLGSRFRPAEPQGKGLKLEETWSPPPKSEDDEEDEEEGDDEEPESSSRDARVEV